MDPIYADGTVSMSEFTANPAAVLRQASDRPVVVLDRNKPAIYLVEPKLFEAMLEAMGDAELRRTVLARQNERANAIEVDVDTV